MLDKFAEDLKKIREAKHISLIQMSEYTRIHLNVLERLERGDFNFVEQPYIRAFLRHYASFLELDEKDVLYAYDMAKSGRYQPLVKEETNLQQESRTENISSTSDEINNVFEIIPEQQTSVEKKEESLRIKKVLVYENPAEKEKALGLKSFMDEDKKIGISPAVSRTLGYIIVIVILLVGIYFIVDTFLISPSKPREQIIRRSFDTVVRENERKLLGIRSKEEIEDSLKKIQSFQDSLKRLSADSLTLEIVALDKGKIIIFVDTLLLSARTEERFKANEKGYIKAKNSFWISSNDADKFQFFVNRKPLSIKEKIIKNLKVTKEGIVKKK
ncbi:MAG: helix-turn-helix domain-containing protein [Ignavibacteria bacterium]